MACVALQQISVISILSASCNKLENRQHCVHILKCIHIRHWKHSLVISGRFNHPRGRHFMMLTIVTFFGDFMDGNFYYCVHWLIVPCLCAGVIVDTLVYFSHSILCVRICSKARVAVTTAFALLAVFDSWTSDVFYWLCLHRRQVSWNALQIQW